MPSRSQAALGTLGIWEPKWAETTKCLKIMAGNVPGNSWEFAQNYPIKTTVPTFPNRYPIPRGLGIPLNGDPIPGSVGRAARRGPAMRQVEQTTACLVMLATMTNKLSLRIVMPWPAAGLSPNARLHWSRLSRLKKPYRALGFQLGQEAMRGLPPYPEKGRLPVFITFHPPDRRHRDDDNMIGSFKAGRDGIAEGVGVNDRRFKPTYNHAEPIKGGMVIVELPHPASVSLTGREEDAPGEITLPDWLKRS